MRQTRCARLLSSFAALVLFLAATNTVLAGSAREQMGTQVATGKTITPMAARGAIFQDLNPELTRAPEWRAGQAAAVAVSPDGKLLAILTSGFNAYFDKDGNLLPEASMEYIFLFDITSTEPKQLQVLTLPHSFQGLAWTPDSAELFASGGKDDTVVEFVRDESQFVPGRTIRLGHKTCLGAKPDRYCGPVAGGLAISPDGSRLLVTNMQNDSVTMIDIPSGEVLAEQDLRPGIIDPKHRGEPGGSFPRAVTWISQTRAYVASARDREILSLAVSERGLRVARRLVVPGQPSALLANSSGRRLYVALDTTGRVAVFDTGSETMIETIDTVAPASVYDNRRVLGGANTNALALTPDQRTLLVSNGGLNSVVVVRLSRRAGPEVSQAPVAALRSETGSDCQEDGDCGHSATVGMVPTGWYPAGVATSKDGATWFVVNGKSPVGPNSEWCQESKPEYCVPKVVAHTSPLFAQNGVASLLGYNMHVNQLEKAGFLAMPAPDGLELARLTKQVAHNNGFDRPEKTASDQRLFDFLHEHIKHVIYIMKENRTYDQVLGDLEVGNGDRRLTLFPENISPNHHRMARNFVTLDNLLVSAEGSMTGRDWTFAAQTNDMQERNDPLFLATGYKGETGGFNYETDRLANTAYKTSQERRALDPSHTADPDILPGTNRIYGLDGPGGESGTGYLWDAALRARLSVRNYGLYEPLDRGPLDRDFRADGRKVLSAMTPSLNAHTDPYYSMIGIADFWRVREWKREFDEFVATKSAPNLTLLYLINDHLGDFNEAIDGVNTPETQMADNDYALGLVTQIVAGSPFAKDTLIVSIEDDASDGPDHVSAERTVALFAGAYVRQHAVVSTRYTTVNVVKTIEEVLGIGPIGLNDALAAPMSDVFDRNITDWSYKATVPDVLYSTKLPLPPSDHAVNAVPKHSAAYWSKVMADQDFSGPDRINPATFNRALWRGLMGNKRYPVSPSEADSQTK